MDKIFIATGGTGGHIIPARTLGAELSKANYQVIIFGDNKYQKYIKEDDNFTSKIISSSQIKKKPLALIQASLKIALGLAQSFYYFIRWRPKYIISFGGYATFPLMLAAIITRSKIILHEQNAYLGKVNRIFAKYAHKIALTYENTGGIDLKEQQKTTLTGNPVRSEILALNQLPYTLPKKYEPIKHDKMGYRVVLAAEFHESHMAFDEPFNILVLGGSGGAKIFSEILPKAIFNLSDDIKNSLHITQQCRSDLVESTFNQYHSFNVNIVIGAFFENMADEIAKAHLVIARSGSSSLAEFCAAKKPMILVPFAKAADDHQMKNAKIAEAAGAAIIIEEKNFTIHKTCEILKYLTQNQQILEKMSKAAGEIAKIDATQNLVNLIKE